MRRFAESFLADERGATAIEYGLIAALLSVVCITAVASIGTHVRDMLFARIIAAFP